MRHLRWMNDATAMLTRRRFINGATALGASALAAPYLHAAAGDEPLIRFGVASAVHILADWRDANCRDLDRQPEYLEKALRWFDSQRADVVVFSGDMALAGPGLVGKPCVRLVFPHAGPSGCSRVFDYVVKAFAEGREIKRFYVLDLEYNLPESRVTAKGECLIGLHELPTGKRISFTVEPRNCYGAVGRSLCCDRLYGGCQK